MAMVDERHPYVLLICPNQDGLIFYIYRVEIMLLFRVFESLDFFLEAEYIN